MTLAEYEATVGPRNKHFHEIAEAVRLHKEGVLPLDPDEDDPGSFSPDDDATIEPPDTHGRP